MNRACTGCPSGRPSSTHSSTRYALTQLPCHLEKDTKHEEKHVESVGVTQGDSVRPQSAAQPEKPAGQLQPARTVSVMRWLRGVHGNSTVTCPLRQRGGQDAPFGSWTWYWGVASVRWLPRNVVTVMTTWLGT